MKKTRNRIIVLLVSFGIAVSSVAAYFMYDSALRIYGCSESYSEYFNDQVRLIYLNNGKRVLISKKSCKYVTPQLDVIFDVDYDEMITVFKLNNKRGYLNAKTGELIIPAQYEYAWFFDEQSGLAACCKNGHIGFIDTTGNFVIPNRFPYDRKAYEYMGIMFEDGYCLIPDGSSGKLGLIDAKGNVVLQPVYDEIEEESLGHRIVWQNGSCGLVDTIDFQLVIDLVCDDIRLFDKGIVITKNDKQCLLDWDFKTHLSDYVFDDIYWLWYNDTEPDEYGDYEYIKKKSIYSIFSIGSYHGVIVTSTGKIIVEPEWDNIDFHSDGIFEASLGYYSVLINEKGEIIN